MKKNWNVSGNYIINNPLKWELDRENILSENYNIESNQYFQDIYEQQ